jgi:hypothetical protein
MPGLSALVMWLCLAMAPSVARAADRVNISHSAISGSQAVLFVTRDAGFFKKYEIDLQILFVDTYAIKYMARVPYPSLKGVETILDDLAKTNPKAKGADPKRFVEPRFLKELEDSGFVAQLYRK